jgi:2-dehydro-3-deoxygluconokinase
MDKRVVTLGEIMMRLSTPGLSRFTDANSLDIVYGGSEANVVISLAGFGFGVEYVTRLPENDWGKSVIQHLKSYGVGTDHIQFGPERLGLYFLENGAMHRAPRIIYDRYHSAFANIKPGSIDWDAIMQRAKWFHWTGITPAISEGAAQVCQEAIEAAAKHGVCISGDINYRRNLWQYGKTARDIMPALVSKTNIIIGGLTDFVNCLGITGDGFEDSCQSVSKQYPQVKKISYTHRESISASHNKIQGILWNGEKVLTSRQLELTHIVDRVGAGDAFMAGLIYGWSNLLPDQVTLEFATAACALKHSIEGDINSVTVAEVETLVTGEANGRLLR